MGKGGYAVRQGKVFEPNMQPVFAPEQPEQAKLEILPGGTGVYVDKTTALGQMRWLWLVFAGCTGTNGPAI